MFGDSSQTWKNIFGGAATAVASAGRSASSSFTNIMSALKTEPDTSQEPPEKPRRQGSSRRSDLIAELHVETQSFLKVLLLPNPGPLTETEFVDPRSNIAGLQASIIACIFSYLPLKDTLDLSHRADIYGKLANELVNDRRYIRRCARVGFDDRKFAWAYLMGDLEEYKSKYVNSVVQWRLIESQEYEANRVSNTLRSVRKDISRTFCDCGNLNFSRDQQRQMQALLGVYTLHDAEIGYVQGMNFVAGLIILAIDDELLSFAAFCHMMKLNHSKPFEYAPPSHIDIESAIRMYGKFARRGRKSKTHSHCAGGRLSKTGQRGYGFRYLYAPCLPRTGVCTKQFDTFFERHLPDLYHLLIVKCELTVESFASEWFMTMFSYVLPVEVSLRVFDLFVVDGWKALHRAGLAVLHRCKEDLFKLDPDEIFVYLKRFPVDVFVDPSDESPGDAFINDAMRFKVTNSELHHIAYEIYIKNHIPHTNRATRRYDGDSDDEFHVF